MPRVGDGTFKTLKVQDQALNLDGAPSYIRLSSLDGTVYYLFVEDDGTVKVHTAIPTANADGSEVGAQS